MIDLNAHQKILKENLVLFPEVIRLCMKRMQDRKTKADRSEYVKKVVEHVVDSINYLAMEIQKEPDRAKCLSPRMTHLAEAIRYL